MLNRVTLMGRLVADPELRSTASNLSVCSFRIAVDRDYKKGDQKETDFIDIVAWRSTAEKDHPVEHCADWPGAGSSGCGGVGKIQQ